MTWQDRAERALALFEGSPDDAGDRTWQIFNHILDESNADSYVSKDFSNVRDTAGGLPDGVSFDGYLDMILGHVRSELNSGSFDEELDDDNFKTAASSFDENIRRHIRFLNGTVHAGAPGDVHVALWEYILNARSDPTSVYSVYSDYLVDA